MATSTAAFAVTEPTTYGSPSRTKSHAPIPTSSTAGDSPKITTSAQSEHEAHLRAKIIAGLAIGGTAIVMMLTFLLWFVLRKHKRRSRRPISIGHFEIDGTALVTPNVGLQHSNASLASLRKSSSTTDVHLSPALQPVCHGTDIYVSDTDAGPVQLTPNVHVLPPRYDPQWSGSSNAVEVLHSGAEIAPYRFRSSMESESSASHGGSFPASPIVRPKS